jgi:hypothetical protein
MDNASQGLLSFIGTVIGSALGGSLLTGYFVYRINARKVPAENVLNLAAAEEKRASAAVQAATAGKIRVEAEGSLLDRMASYCDRIEQRLKEEHLKVMRLERDKKVLEARADLYEDQMRKVKALLEKHGLEFPS